MPLRASNTFIMSTLAVYPTKPPGRNSGRRPFGEATEGGDDSRTVASFGSIETTKRSNLSGFGMANNEIDRVLRQMGIPWVSSLLAGGALLKIVSLVREFAEESLLGDVSDEDILERARAFAPDFAEVHAERLAVDLLRGMSDDFIRSHLDDGVLVRIVRSETGVTADVLSDEDIRRLALQGVSDGVPLREVPVRSGEESIATSSLTMSSGSADQGSQQGSIGSETAGLLLQGSMMETPDSSRRSDSAAPVADQAEMAGGTDVSAASSAAGLDSTAEVACRAAQAHGYDILPPDHDSVRNLEPLPVAGAHGIPLVHPVVSPSRSLVHPQQAAILRPNTSSTANAAMAPGNGEGGDEETEGVEREEETGDDKKEPASTKRPRLE